MDHSAMDHHHHHNVPDTSSASLESSNPLSSPSLNPTAPCHDMDHGSGAHSMMAMFFHWGFNEVILFSQWKISSPSGLIASMLGIFLLAALYEGLKYYREYLFWKTYNDLHYRSIPGQRRGESTENKDINVGLPVCDVLQKTPPSLLMCSVSHFFQTILHMVQITLSFLLMLVFMTYNIWLCLAVVLGAGCGYFLFGWKKSVIVDVTEHCH